MTAFIIFTLFTWVAGIAIGATVVRDWLDTIRRRRSAKPPTVLFPRAELINRRWKRLELPPCRRHQRIGVVKVIDVG